MHRIFPIALTAACALLAATAGCSAQSKTVKRETVEYPASEARVTSSEPVVVERTTETHEEKSDEGVLSTTIDLVGTVLAFPFRVVGALIRAIF